MAENSNRTRKVLSNDEFLQYKEQLTQSGEIKINAYAVILIKEYYKGSLAELSQTFEIPEEEIPDALRKALGIDIKTITEESFLANIPEEQKEDFQEAKGKILENPTDLARLIDDGELTYIANNIDQKQRKEKLELYKILSNSDLSEVSPESFYDCKFLEQINLEGSGARLDMANFEYNVNVRGSIKGCELITFSKKHYLAAQEKKDDINGFVIESSIISPECLDKSQYLTVLESFKNSQYIYLSNEESFLYEEQEIQDKIQWLFDKILEDEMRYVWGVWNIFKAMTPETRTRNQKYIDKILELLNKNTFDRDYCIENVMKYFNIDQFNKYYSDILNLYMNEDKEIDTEGLLKSVWGKCNSEVQIENFTQFLEFAKKGETRDSDLFDIMWENSAEETQKMYLDRLIEETRDESGNLDINEVSRILSRTKKQVDISQKHFQEILSLYENGQINEYTFSNLWKNMGDNTQKSNLISILSIYEVDEKNIEEYEQIWNKTDFEVQIEKYDEIVKNLEEKWPDFAHKFKGKLYIELIHKMSEEEKNHIFENNMPRFLNALREKYNCTNAENIKQDGVNYDSTYGTLLLNMDELNSLNDINTNTIIENLPTLGVELINRVVQSNSLMISQNADKIIPNMALHSKAVAEDLLDEIENVFSQKNLPSFMKLFKYFELAGYEESINFKDNVLSPVLLSTESKKLSKLIIFSDLMRISMDSNNKTMKEFIDVLEKGNIIYTNVMKNNINVDSLTPTEQTQAKEYIKTIYFLYEESAASRIDKNEGKKLKLTGDIKKDFELIGKRYSHNGIITDLPDRVLKNFIGPYQEIFKGMDSVAKIKTYMKERVEESNNRHRELAKEKIELKTGDMVKGVHNGDKLFAYILSDGLRAGEFLGISSHSDSTKLDTDFSVILNNNKGNSLYEKIKNTVAGSYGSMYVVLKYDPSRIEYTRKDDEHEIQNSDTTLSERLTNRKEAETIKKRIANRVNEEYESLKLEVFLSNVMGKDHYGIRTGIGATDIDYIVLDEQYSEKLGYELAMSGIYIPIVDIKTEEVIFTPEDYDKVRTKMQGLSHYETQNFQVEETAYVKQTKEIVEELFPSGNAQESVSEREATIKRNAIQYQTAKALHEKMNLGLSDRITGDLTEGFVEFIDTGSTGRGTNLPGDGDFDFTLKLDKTILENPTKLKAFKEALREVLAIKSEHKESSLDEANGNFRYKKVKIEGLETPVDLDITFVSKNEEVVYSTDMCVRDRLENIKKTDPEGYKYTIANIVLAKQLLKKEGLYKKSGSPDASEYGGFGGVGVENWILQNGGSLSKAIETFLEASQNAKNYEEFQKMYPIFDFGENHMAKGYRHDSFIFGLTELGYEQMQIKLKEIQKDLSPITVKKSTTYLSETLGENLQTLTKNSRKGKLEETLGEVNSAVHEIAQVEQGLAENLSGVAK